MVEKNDESDTRSFLSSPDFLNKFLGTFEIKDRPKRSIYRFIKDEKRFQERALGELLQANELGCNLEQKLFEKSLLSDESLYGERTLYFYDFKIFQLKGLYKIMQSKVEH